MGNPIKLVPVRRKGKTVLIDNQVKNWQKRRRRAFEKMLKERMAEEEVDLPKIRNIFE